MKKAVAILGPPASGKTSLLQSYTSQVLSIGDYAKSLPETNPVKVQCLEHWAQNKVFSSGLLRELVDLYPTPNSDLILLDGTPRNQEQQNIVQGIFDIVGRVIITVDDVVWDERALLASKERKDVLDSTYQKLLERKRVYEREIAYVQTLPFKFYLNNSGTFDKAKERLDEIINRITSDQLRGGSNGRIYGYCG